MRYSKMSLMAAAVAVAVTFAGCTDRLMPPASPRDIAAQTRLDEKALIAVEASWRAAGVLLEEATDAGLVEGDAALRAEATDARAEKWVQAARTAYDAGNADDYWAALSAARNAVAQLRAMGADKLPQRPVLTGPERVQ